MPIVRLVGYTKKTRKGEERMKSIKELEIEEKLAVLRKKWIACQKKNDLAMCKVYELMSKPLKSALRILHKNDKPETTS